MDHVLIAYDPHLVSWWWFAIPVIACIVCTAVLSKINGAGLAWVSTFFLWVISMLALSAVMGSIESQHRGTADAKTPSVERVAQAFNLTSVGHGEYADAHNNRYTDCYTRSHLVSPTMISAQLFCLKDGRPATVHTEKN